MATLTAATASSRPREPQLMMRVRTPSRQTLENKQKNPDLILEAEMTSRIDVIGLDGAERRTQSECFWSYGSGQTEQGGR